MLFEKAFLLIKIIDVNKPARAEIKRRRTIPSSGHLPITAMAPLNLQRLQATPSKEAMPVLVSET
jgi:hypothetical protein